MAFTAPKSTWPLRRGATVGKSFLLPQPAAPDAALFRAGSPPSAAAPAAPGAGPRLPATGNPPLPAANVEAMRPGVAADVGQVSEACAADIPLAVPVRSPARLRPSVCSASLPTKHASEHPQLMADERARPVQRDVPQAVPVRSPARLCSSGHPALPRMKHAREHPQLLPQLDHSRATMIPGRSPPELNPNFLTSHMPPTGPSP